MKFEPLIDAPQSQCGGKRVFFAALQAFPIADMFALVYN